MVHGHVHRCVGGHDRCCHQYCQWRQRCCGCWCHFGDFTPHRMLLLTVADCCGRPCSGSWFDIHRWVMMGRAQSPPFACFGRKFFEGSFFFAIGGFLGCHCFFLWIDLCIIVTKKKGAVGLVIKISLRSENREPGTACTESQHTQRRCGDDNVEPRFHTSIIGVP